MSVTQFILFELFMTCCGVGFLFKPEVMWKIQHILDVKGGAPTEWYLFRARVTGAVMLVIAVGGLIVRFG